MKKKILVLFLLSTMILGGCSTQKITDSSSQKEETQEAKNQDISEKSTDGEADESQEASKDVFAMDTYMTVTAYGSHGEEAVEKAAAEIERLDGLLSTGEESSEIAQVNANGGGTLGKDASYLVERALEFGKSTGGAFDIAIYPIMKEWGFTTGDFKVPSKETLDGLLEKTKLSDVVFDKETSTISFKTDGMAIDLGGIAKGYTSTRIMDIYRECGVKSGLVNLGGNVQALGTKTDGSKWRVAIQGVDDDDSYLGVLSISDKAVITSGGYERYFEQDGVTYHHIIDPTTGYPADSGLLSVSIVSADGTMCDSLSTSLFIMGKDKAIEYWRAHSDEFDMILYDKENKVYVSEGIAEDFTSDFDTEVVKKE